MTITQSSTRLAALTLGVAAVVAVAFGAAFATPAHAASVCPNTWSKNLTVGSKGSDVMKLQQFLNMDSSTAVAVSGAGSAGMETSTFGPATKKAVINFQTKYGISAIGSVGPMTRAKLNSLCTGSTTTGGTTTGGTTTTTTGTGLSVMAAAQPANGIAPFNAARIPFTKFTVSASNDGDVTLNSVTVERQGIARDAAFSGVMLLDENGNQVGITKTLNSNHQAVVGAAIVIPRGTTKTFTVAANRPDSSVTGYSGQIATFAVVAVNSSAAVNGALPISGASYTINETSNVIGTVTAQRGTNDPGASNSENVGQTNYIFSSVRLTAGSAEPVYVKSIRWHQVGSASQSYLNNVVTVVGGTSYPTMVSSDNYYTTTFPGNGIMIDKGNSSDIAIQGDIVNGSNTNVEFDIQKRTDINVVGGTYGFGILPSLGNSSSQGQIQSNDDPYYYGYSASIQSGTITVSTSNSVSASNVAINQQGQILGGWSVQDQGEPVTVGRMVFNLSMTGSATYADLTNISLVDQNGATLAGPVDATVGSASDAQAIFTDTVTLPIGTTQLFLKGKLGTTFSTNNTVTASTTPSTGWTTVTGQTTGRSLTISGGTLTSVTMTVKAVALSLSVSSVPIAQTVIAGTNQFTFGNIVLDATASGEDVRVTTLPIKYTWSGNANDLTNCQLYNGSTKLSDQHIYNPSSATSPATGSDVAFSINSGGLTVAKGSSVTVSVACDLRSGSTGSYSFGLSSSPTVGAAGVTSGQSVTATVSASVGNTMTASSGGSMTVAIDSSSPSRGVVSAGATGVDLGHIKFNATNENIDLRQVALKLTSGSRTDLVNGQVTLWDAQTNTQIATAVFPSGTTATSSAIASGSFRIPANGSRVLIIKGDIAAVNTNGPITASGDLLKVDYDGNNVSNTDGTYGVGVSSGQNRTPASASTAVNGVTIYKSFPTFTYSTSNATAVNGSQTLLQLTVAADSKGDVTLNKLTFSVATTTATLSAVTFTGPNGNVSSSTNIAQADGTKLTVYFDSASNTQDAVVSAGSTKTYTMRGTLNLTGSNSTGSVSIALKGDNAGSVGTAGSLSSSNVIWSPESTTTTTSVNNNDWANGYGLGGCFSTAGLGNDCFSAVLSK